MQKTAENPDGPVLHFARRTGRAELDEHAQPVNVGEYILTMNPHAGVRRDEFLKTVLADLRAEVPGVEIEAEQPLSHLISHMLSGVNAQVAVKIFGDDLDKLRELAGEVRTALVEVPGVTPPIIDPQERVDELHVVLRPDDLALYGISREYVADFVQTALKGEAVSKVLEGQRRFDLVIKLARAVPLRPGFPEGAATRTAGRPRPDAAQGCRRFPRGRQRPESGQPRKRAPQANRPLQCHRPRPGRRDRRNRAEGSSSGCSCPKDTSSSSAASSRRSDRRRG